MRGIVDHPGSAFAVHPTAPPNWRRGQAMGGIVGHPGGALALHPPDPPGRDRG